MTERRPEKKRQGFTAAPQRGTPGHCTVAQVFGPDGRSVLAVESTINPARATAIAELCALALNREAAALPASLAKGHQS